MLPDKHRIRSREHFELAVRRGRRAGRASLVVHLFTSDPPADRVDGADSADSADGADSTAAPRAGFIVSRAVGGAVVRNRVRRRLRHLVAARIGRLPPRSLLVVRAQPGAVAAGGAGLATDLDDAVSKLLSRKR